MAEARITIALRRDDARRLGLPAGAEVEIEPTLRKGWPKGVDVYYKGEFSGTAVIELPEVSDGYENVR